MAKDAEPQDAAAEPAAVEAPRVSKLARFKKLVIPVAMLASLGIGAGATWFVVPHGAAPAKKKAAAAAGEEGAAEGEGAADAAEDAADAEAAAEESAAAAEEAQGPPQYLAINPSFVVNLTDDEAMRFLQVEMEVMTRDAAVIDAVKTHMPVIRNNVLLLMGQKRFHEINTREGKEALRAEVLAEMQQVLTQQTGKAGVEAVYFTSFVMQ